MTKQEELDLINKWIKDGGEVETLKPSNRNKPKQTVKTRSGFQKRENLIIKIKAKTS